MPAYESERRKVFKIMLKLCQTQKYWTNRGYKVNLEWATTSFAFLLNTGSLRTALCYIKHFFASFEIKHSLTIRNLAEYVNVICKNILWYDVNCAHIKSYFVLSLRMVNCLNVELL